MRSLPAPGHSRLFAQRMAAVQPRLDALARRVAAEYAPYPCLRCDYHTAGPCPQRGHCLPGYYCFTPSAQPPAPLPKPLTPAQTMQGAPAAHPRPWRPPAEAPPARQPRKAPAPAKPIYEQPEYQEEA